MRELFKDGTKPILRSLDSVIPKHCIGLIRRAHNGAVSTNIANLPWEGSGILHILSTVDGSLYRLWFNLWLQLRSSPVPRVSASVKTQIKQFFKGI